MRSTSPALFLGTRSGLFRWQDGVVAPLSSGSDPIESLLPLQGGRLLAGTVGARVLALGPGDRQVPWSGDPTRGAITSLFHLPATRRVLAGADGESLFVSDDFGASFEECAPFGASGRRLELIGVPALPRSVLAFAENGVWHSPDAGAHFESWSATPLAGLRCAAVHPYDSQLWLVATRDELLRSLDGARSFRAVAGLPPKLRVRALRFETHAPHRLFLLAEPTGLPPEPKDNSPLGVSEDGGRSFVFLPSRLVDRARDPSGEITSLAVWRDHDRTMAGFGTDRGELLVWRGGDSVAELVADAFPPIATLAPVAAAHALDPSTSGIYLLP